MAYKKVDDMKRTAITVTLQPEVLRRLRREAANREMATTVLASEILSNWLEATIEDSPK